MIPREEYYKNGLFCNFHTFALECMELKTSFSKSQNYNDIKSHHLHHQFRSKRQRRKQSDQNTGTTAWFNLC